MFQPSLFRGIRRLASILVLAILGVQIAAAQGTAFTYQGQLASSGNPANGNYDLQFKLFDAVTAGTQQGATVTNPTVAVNNGVFSIQLDFGASAFPGAARYLEIGVRPAGDQNPYVVLAPRQPITSSPYAIQSLNTAQLGGLPANRFVQSDTNGNFEITNGKLGIGVANPVAPLHVNGTGWFQGNSTPLPASAGAGVGIGTGSDGTGYVFGFDYGANTPKNLALNGPGGNIGIGTNAPASLLHISGAGTGGNTNTGGNYSGLSIDAITNNFTTSFSGYSMRIRSLSGFGNFVRTDLFITGDGNVGLGTNNPFHHLAIYGGPGWTTNGWTGLAELQNGGALAWAPNTANNRFGIGQTNGGLYFFRTNSPIGSATAPAKYDLIIGDDDSVSVNVMNVLGGADFSESFDVAAPAESKDHSVAQIEPGLIVAIDPLNPGKLVVSQQAYDRRVAGIISGAGGVRPGLIMKQERTLADGQHPVALSGRVYCWADATHGAIEAGDLLTTSDMPGHAMKAVNHKRMQGAIIGKAMTGLKTGKGLVLVLVTLQ